MIVAICDMYRLNETGEVKMVLNMHKETNHADNMRRMEDQKEEIRDAGHKPILGTIKKFDETKPTI